MINQSEAIQSKPANRRQSFRECFDRVLLVFYRLWTSMIDFFFKPKRASLEEENRTLRATLNSQKQLFAEALTRHEPLLQRIFTLEASQESSQQEHQKILGRANALEKEIVFLKKVASDQTKRADVLAKSKEAELSELNERYKALEVGNKDLKNASSGLQTELDGLKKKYTCLDTEKRKVDAALSTLGDTREKETSKWVRLVKQKTLEKNAMDYEMSLLRQANDRMETEREERKEILEELKDEMDKLKKASTKYVLEKDSQKEISARLESEKEKLEANLTEQARKLEAEIAKHVRKIEAQRRDITGKEEALSRVRKTSSNLKSEVESLRHSFKRVKQDKTDLKDELSRLERTKSVLETKLNERQRIIDLKQREMKAWDGQSAQNEAIIDTLNKEKEELRNEISKLQSEKEEMESRNQEFKEALNEAKRKAENAKEKRERGYAFLENMMGKMSEDLKRFLTTDAQTRDAQRRDDLRCLKEVMEDNKSLLKRNDELTRQRMQLENRARDAEERNAMYEQNLHNNAVLIAAPDIPPHAQGMGG